MGTPALFTTVLPVALTVFPPPSVSRPRWHSDQGRPAAVRIRRLPRVPAAKGRLPSAPLPRAGPGSVADGLMGRAAESLIKRDAPAPAADREGEGTQLGEACCPHTPSLSLAPGEPTWLGLQEKCAWACAAEGRGNARGHSTASTFRGWTGQMEGTGPRDTRYPPSRTACVRGRPKTEQRTATGDQARDVVRAPAPALQTTLEKMS